MESSFLIKRNYDLVVVIVVDISRVILAIVLDASDDRVTATTARAQHSNRHFGLNVVDDFPRVRRSSDYNNETRTTRDEAKTKTRRRHTYP